MALKRNPNVADPDGLYAAIIDAHADLSEAESVALNACLVLLLANHIGDPAVLAAIAGVLFLVGVVASWLPARRAASIDPLQGLRAD
jgi:hypothetical protein